ncbi:hypothetical protein ACO0LB_19630, partial [Undibacterium sp. SXout7W]|uniref:hypothetical protein n=1 Tax=Undibacterium sp. SXout7W TaxID=3413049 RepID=UPI003BF2C24E
SKAWTSLLATVIPVDRVLTGVSKISTEVKTLTVVGEDAAVATTARKVEQGGRDGGELVASAGSSKPAWLEKLDAGNEFNKVRSSAYPFNEVYIESPKGTGYTRVDSYNPISGEIVSRKFTQLSEVQEQTAINYIKELPAKYPVGATIANVPSSESLARQLLQGQHILEVPVQINPIPQSVLDAANRAGVLIRDVNGKMY